MPASPTLPDLATVVGCIGDYDPAALRVDQVHAMVNGFVRPLQTPERVDLRAALGRVLAEDVIAPQDVPAHDNAGMDGYALRGADLAAMARPRCAGSAPAWRDTSSAATCLRDAACAS